ncbi:DUF1801 domain-containing protein [Aeromicrobium sp. Leaf350]|uniref:DUF1801 domain-containing protein n=1 Tax=Aeromicrobium sp. Leaf350 TaxID=2876565 RepID=UPI001E48F48E|nr:DUF1801 domain-containing protein [Aeromicrobium sp. Leaf350]
MADDAKTRPTEVEVDDFVASLGDPATRDDCAALVELMSRASGAPPVMWGPSIIGFDRYHYRYASGREGDAALVGFSPRVGKLSIYLNDGTDQHTEALSRLGRHSVTKACLHVKRLGDVDLAVLEEIVRASATRTRAAHA